LQSSLLLSNLRREISKPRLRIRRIVVSHWLFTDSPISTRLGYNAARTEYYREMAARGLSPRFEPTGSDAQIVNELLFRLESLAAWLEAQDAWTLWRNIVAHPAAWNSEDPLAQEQARHAALIATFPHVTDSVSDSATARIVEDFGKWTKPQWANVLKAAARLAAKPDKPITKIDDWVWWRFPIFRRYRWSAAEVCRAAEERFRLDDELINVAAFQLAWIRRGLRFTGSKTNRKKPPLWDFVVKKTPPQNVPRGFVILPWITYVNS
jgi:hypothetical protein